MQQTIKRLFAALVMGAFLAACGGGGYTRGIFAGYVMGKTEAEVIDKVGKPVKVEKVTENLIKMTFEKKTFNPDDGNKTDNQTVVSLRKDEQGKVTVYDVDFL